MKTLSAIEGGLAGAAALTLIHEAIKTLMPKAPRMDLLGQEAVAKSWQKLDGRAPEKQLYPIALAGDLVGNAFVYSLAGIGSKENALVKGAALGLAAGIAAVALPETLGFNGQYSGRTAETRLVTVALYITGGIVAAAVMKLLEKRKNRQHKHWHHRLVTSARS